MGRDLVQLTVVNIIHVCERVLWVINNQWSSEPVAILICIMRAVPVRSTLTLEVELVVQPSLLANRALIDVCDTVGPIGTVLKDSVPMLWKL